MGERTVAARPKARAEGVVVRELDEEVLVYDLDTHRAVCLNGAAAAVWRLCDGRRTPDDIRRAAAATDSCKSDSKRSKSSSTSTVRARRTWSA